jgi:acyl dehydratase
MSKSFADLHTGLTFTSPAYRIAEDEALEFARDFDPQPFHTDAEAAKSSLFKGLSVSGWYTAARVFSLILQSGVDIDGGIIGQKVEELQWLAPVRPGDTLTVRSRIVEVTPSAKDPRRGTFMLESIAANQHGADVFMVRARILAPAPRQAATGT